MKRRPLLAVLLGLVTGITVARLAGMKSPPYWIGPVAVVTGLGFLGLESKRPREETGTIAVVFLSVLLGISCWGGTYFDPGNLYRKIADFTHVKGMVANFPVTVDGAQEFTVELEDYPGKLKVYSEKVYELDYGDRLCIEGDFQVPEVSGEFNYREYLRKRKVWGIVYDTRLTRLSGNRGNLLTSLSWSIRKLTFNRIENLFPKNGGFIKAVLFGARDYLSEGDEMAFEKTGLAHLLAASGLHLGILIGGGWLISSWVGLSKKTTYLLSLPLLLTYLMVVGFKLPLVRASILYLFSGAGFYFRDKGAVLSSWYDLYNSLTGAAILLLLFQPTSLTEAGFQLSFGATFAIAYLFEPIEANLAPIKPRYVRETLAASLGAQLGVTPIIALHFQRVHPWGVPLSLFSIPTVTVILYLSAASIAVGDLILLGGPLRWVTSSLIDLFILGLKWASRVPLVAIDPGKVNSFALAAYLVFLFWIKRLLNRRRVFRSTYTLTEERNGRWVRVPPFPRHRR